VFVVATARWVPETLHEPAELPAHAVISRAGDKIAPIRATGVVCHPGVGFAVGKFTAGAAVGKPCTIVPADAVRTAVPSPGTTLAHGLVEAALVVRFVFLIVVNCAAVV